MEGMKNQVYKSKSCVLPQDVLETILSQLPAKSLVRFEVVSKAWNSMISSSTFAAIHLKRSKTSRNMFLYAYHPEKLTEIKIAENKFKKLSRGQPGPISNYCLLISHGLMLSRHGSPKDKTLWLCSPSTRTCLKFKCPNALDFTNLDYGLCYDSSPRNYKVLVIDWNYYAIFHYTTNYWSEVKTVNPQVRKVVDEIQRCQILGLPYEGNLYWTCKTLRRAEDGTLEVEGLFFNSRKEEFKRFACRTSYSGARGLVSTVISNSCLCIVVYALGDTKIQKILSAKLDSDGQPCFTEIDMKIPVKSFSLYPLLMPNEDEIIVLDFSKVALFRFMLFNIRNQACTEILSGMVHDDCIQTTLKKFFKGTAEGYYEIPYVDNLFLNRSINDEVLPYD